MRMTIDIHDSLFERANRFAAGLGKELAEVVNDALVEKLGREEAPGSDRPAAPYRVEPFSSEPRPGIDLSSNASIQEAMDEEFRDPVTGAFDLDRLK